MLNDGLCATSGAAVVFNRLDGTFSTQFLYRFKPKLRFRIRACGGGGALYTNENKAGYTSENELPHLASKLFMKRVASKHFCSLKPVASTGESDSAWTEFLNDAIKGAFIRRSE